MIRILSFILLTSCGLRSDDELFKNPLKGDWNLDSIKCYKPDIRGQIAEDFPVPENDRIEMNFGAKSFSYSVASSSGTGCTLSSTGSYTIDFENTVTGLITYGNINGASSTNCEIQSTDNRGAGTYNVKVEFLSLRDEVSDLYWSKDSGNILIQTNSGFKGSPSTVDGFCASNCTCYNLFVPN
jgi:hypothetical protein